MEQSEIRKTFRRIMDEEQKEVETKIRLLLSDLEKSGGRCIYIKALSENGKFLTTR